MNTEHSANHGETLALLGAQTFLQPDIIATDSHHITSISANLPAEASDDMKHISNGDTWREVWRHLGVRSLMFLTTN